jgi:predicted ATP-dependent Lon-type protease
MKLIEAYFSWEVDAETGSQTILFPNLRQAKKRAKELIEYEIETHVAICEKYDDITPLNFTVEFDRVTVAKLTPETFCYIINNTGGGYVEHREPVAKIEKHWKPRGKLK